MKNNIKKFTALFLAALIAVFTLTACGTPDTPVSGTDTVSGADVSSADAVRAQINIGGMTGPTGMGLAKLLSDDEAGTSLNDYEFTLAGSADVLAPMVIKGELDIAAVPANLASVLYNKTQGGIQVLAINTLGVLYVVNNDGSVASLSDLVGKTIYATGQGAAPEYALRYVLNQNGIDPDKDLTIEWRAEPAEVVSLMASGDCTVAMLPQPYVTVAKGKVEGLSEVIDITKEWDALDTDSLCLTGVVVAQKSFVESNPEAVKSFLSEYEASINFAVNNVEEAAAMIGHFEIIAEAVAAKALPYCNLTFISGSEMRTALEGYLNVLYAQNPAAVGGTMPADDFYYGA